MSATEGGKSSGVAARPNGPFDSDRQVRELPAVRAIFAAFDADPGAGKMAPHSHRMLTDAIAAAGVQLGAYDNRIVRWLAGWEPETCAVIAGLIARAHQATAPTGGQLRTMLSALDVAAEAKRDAADACGDCDGRPDGGLCGTCEWRLAVADDYDQLAEQLRERL